MEGLIRFLLSGATEARELREKFVLKLVPMLNPDGVHAGNYRHGALGVDLNRRWARPSAHLHPEVYYVKSMLKYLHAKMRQPEVRSGGVVFFTDIHGHSRRMDTFVMSCNSGTQEQSSQHQVTANNLLVRAAPDALDQCIAVFNARSCSFANEGDKGETARCVLFNELGILNSHTFEITFWGSHLLR